MNTVYPPRVHHVHDVKLANLSRWKQVDVPLPDTLSTNNPERAREFLAKHGKVVVKPLAPALDANVVEEENAAEDVFAELENCPNMIQKFKQGTDSRVYAVDGELFQAYEYDYDTRSFKFDDDISIQRIEVSEQLRQDAVDAVGMCGLSFESVDVRRRGHEDYDFLEVNPDRSFGDKDEAVSALADYLLNGD